MLVVVVVCWWLGWLWWCVGGCGGVWVVGVVCGWLGWCVGSWGGCGGVWVVVIGVV